MLITSTLCRFSQSLLFDGRFGFSLVEKAVTVNERTVRNFDFYKSQMDKKSSRVLF